MRPKILGFLSMSKDVVLELLNRLVAKGYVIRWGESDVDTLRLDPRAPDLTLFSDGQCDSGLTERLGHPDHRRTTV
jgi:hypothetical protein